MYRPLGEQIFQNPRFGTRLTDESRARCRGYGCHGEALVSIELLPP
jgi:hypothetical protein